MAHYNITSLNYLTSGKDRSLVNIDYALADSSRDHLHMLATDQAETSAVVTETGRVEWKKTDYIKQQTDPANPALALQDSEKSAVLNEYQPYALSAEAEPKFEIRLALECDRKRSYAESLEFNRNHQFKNQTFQLEKNRGENSKTWLSAEAMQIAPMYDLMDLCIKSSVKKPAFNDALAGDMNVDQYMTLDRPPVQACQTDLGNAFILTHPSTKQDYIFNTSLRQSRYGVDDKYVVNYVQQEDGTCLYAPSAEFEDGTDSMGGHIAAGGTHPEQLPGYFEPRYVMRNIEYNKLVEIDQNSGRNPTRYDTGDTYGDFILAKNHLNPCYSMDMDSYGRIKNCRTYCGAHKSNQYIVLKYYDDSGYRYAGGTPSRKNGARLDMLPDGRPSTLPYQKVEFLQNVNHSAEGGRTFHKSNLFSVRVRGTGLNSVQSDPNTEEKAELIKTDIRRMVREIAENICPANTQLFNVYIDD